MMPATSDRFMSCLPFECAGFYSTPEGKSIVPPRSSPHVA
jgi:hypothetical protein